MSAITIITQHYNRVLDNKDSRKESVQHWKNKLYYFCVTAFLKILRLQGKVLELMRKLFSIYNKFVVYEISTQKKMGLFIIF